MRLCLGAFLFLLSLNLQAADLSEAQLLEIAYSPYWLRLVHYKKNFWGTYTSEADGKDFFLAPDGKKNPLRELQASLAAFAKPSGSHGKIEQHPQCAFPERFRFLRTQVKLDFPVQECPDFQNWKKGLDAKSVTYVFSTAYPNNPGSMFGHSFLRLNSKKQRELLDYGVNFSAAMPEDVSSMEYTIYGITGGFAGLYSIAPYFEKVNEYSDAEMRDLWEYDLNLNEEETERLVNHLWELYANTYFSYYFLTKNCSYQLMTLLEVAKPAWNISNYYTLFALPADTVHTLKAIPGAILAENFRPSIKKRMLQKRAWLEKAELESYKKAIHGQQAIGEITNAYTLEALAAYYNFRKFQEKNKIGVGESQKHLRETLLTRAKISGSLERPLPEISKKSQVDLGHHSSSVGLLSGRTAKENYFGMQMHAGLHDLLNREVGFEPYSQIDYFHLQLHYRTQKKRLAIAQIKLAELNSLYPWDNFDRRFSWRIALQAQPLKKVDCSYCLTENIEAGGGISLPVPTGLFYSLLLWNTEYSAKISPHLALGPNILNGLLLEPLPNLRWLSTARWKLDLNKSSSYWEYSSSLAYGISQSWDLRALWDWSPSPAQYSDARVNINYYY